jgi:hypothetical protein
MSGESKVGFLNNSHPRNLIHKVFLPVSLGNTQNVESEAEMNPADGQGLLQDFRD